MSDHSAHSRLREATRRQAADWVARRDRGFAPAEQDEYLQWLRQSPEHPAAINEYEATFRRLTALRDLPAAEPLLPPRLASAPWRRWSAVVALGLAAAITFLVWPPALTAPAVSAPSGCLKVNVHRTLPDGSVVELREGSEIQTRFSASERRVILLRGEASFTVVHRADRPFVVEAGAVVVRDLGTVFDVRLDQAAVQVLVTAGEVSLDTRIPIKLVAGERAVIALAGTLPIQIETVGTAAQTEALVWQSPRFEFSSTPLPVAVDEFNRRSAVTSGPKLTIGDTRLSALRIGGTLRADDVEGFLRLLQMTVGIRTERRGDKTIVLWRAR